MVVKYRFSNYTEENQIIFTMHRLIWNNKRRSVWEEEKFMGAAGYLHLSENILLFTTLYIFSDKYFCYLQYFVINTC